MLTTRGRLLASTMIAGAAALTLNDVAQAADAGSPLQTASGAGAVAAGAAPIRTVTAAADDTSGGTQVTEIVVTGSRIPQPNLSSVSPIQAIGHQQFDLTGKTDVIDLLNTLPANFQNNTSDFSNTTNPLTSPGGVSTADLRGLGPQRTLVLINGRRLGLGDPNTADPNPAPDLDQIPVALIDHVEVLTGGASSTYGSDAVAGVVNFIMKKDFEGVQVDGHVGIANHDNTNSAVQQAILRSGSQPATGSKWDGKTTDFSVVIGANAPDGKGNVTGYFEFKNAEPVTEGSRDFSGCLLALGAPDACANSTSSNRYREFFPATATNGPFLTQVGSSLLPYPQANSVPPPTFNSSPYEFLSRQDTRYLGGFYAHYNIADWVQPYAEFSFMSDRSASVVAPSGGFQNGGPAANQGFLVNCGNPFLSAQEQGALACSPAMIAGVQTDPANQVDIVIGRRNIEGGGRESTYDHENYRIVLGLKGDFADAWHYDAYGSYYYTTLYNQNQNYLSFKNMQDSLLVGGTAAAPTCLSGNPSCVGWNIFNAGGVTQAAENFLEVTGTGDGTIEEQIFEGDVSGDLGKYGVKSPWANDGIGLAFGVSHRWDHLKFAPDAAELSGDLSGFGGASVAVDNAISVQEEYFETRIPIVQQRPLIEDLVLEGGYRYSDYSTSGAVSTYKVAGEWAPSSDIRFRASYDRAIRAASILEAFNPQSVTNTSAVGEDLCAPDPTTGLAKATLAQCMHTGVTAAQYGNGGTTDSIQQCVASQCSTLTGGNTKLSPEIADTYSIGASFTPSFLHGFTGSIDYFDITINGEIGVVPLAISYNNCLQTGDPTFCSNIVRNATGALTGVTVAAGGYIKGIGQNVATSQTSGLDFQGSYRLPLEDIGAAGLGSVSFNFVGTYLLSAKTLPLKGQAEYDCAALFGPTCAQSFGSDNPAWRHTFSVAWNTPWNVVAQLQWRYLSATSLDANNTQAGLGGPGLPGGFDAFDAKLGSINYLDLSGAWRVNSVLTIRAGVNNIFDQDPPIVSQGVAGIGAPNTYPTYDLLGRQLFISGTAKF
ncbi:MAG TPA: TonB-dependent receptor [Caulobacteraceae bacterium]|jgi:outer membrane receptor protein involved in Fe transport